MGFCWFCNNCKQHQLQYVSGTSIIWYNEENITKHGARFIRCKQCQQLMIKYSNFNDYKCESCGL